MVIKLYNSLSKKKETFKPLSKKEVKMYTCGPTVYWYATIGNLRSYIFADTLKRTLLYNKLKVKHVINITDVGHLTSDADYGQDKMEVAARREKKTAQQISKHYFNTFNKDLKQLHFIQPKKWTPATKYIKEQLALIKSLETKGYTYQTQDGIYYNTKKFKKYNKLFGLNREDQQEGKRVKAGEKKNKTDFALWKFSKPEENRQQEWKSKWGTGFPGWHIECSAMILKELGKTIDIHTGGEDHKQIHHPNEIAQSEASTGKPFVKYWLHNAFLVNEQGEKVSKSKGGLYTLTELIELGYAPEHLRYLYLQTHYRKQLKFSIDNLDAAKAALDKIKRKFLEAKSQKHKGKDLTKTYEAQFLKAINEDLNMPLALQVFIKTLQDYNFSPSKKIKLLLEFDKVLGLDLKNIKEPSHKPTKEVEELLIKRNLARAEKDFAQADILRNIIKEKGYIIEDLENHSKLSKV